MTIKKIFVGTAFSSFCVGILVLSGCSSTPFSSSKNAQNISATGPTILDAKTNPGTVELNADLKAPQNPQIFADVKDFNSPVKEVRARFIHVPIELSMNQLAGTTWEASLTPDQVKQLAVAGQTMHYQANIVATDADGRVAVTQSPIDIAIKSPDASQLTANLQRQYSGVTDTTNANAIPNQTQPQTQTQSAGQAAGTAAAAAPSTKDQGVGQPGMLGDPSTPQHTDTTNTNQPQPQQ